MKTTPTTTKISFAFLSAGPISKHEAERKNHAIHAKTALARAQIVIRLLLGEDEWSDGYERKLDDCFEMNDGDAVCGWLLEMADQHEGIRRLLTTHRNVGSSFITWQKYRGAHCAKLSAGQTTLALA